LNATILSEEKQSTDPEDLELFKKYLKKKINLLQKLRERLFSDSNKIISKHFKIFKLIIHIIEIKKNENVKLLAFQEENEEYFNFINELVNEKNIDQKKHLISIFIDMINNYKETDHDFKFRDYYRRYLTFVIMIIQNSKKKKKEKEEFGLSRIKLREYLVDISLKIQNIKENLKFLSEKFNDDEKFLSLGDISYKFNEEQITKLKSLSIYKEYKKTQLFKLQKKISKYAEKIIDDKKLINNTNAKIDSGIKANEKKIIFFEIGISLPCRCIILSEVIGKIGVETMLSVIEKSKLNNNDFFKQFLTIGDNGVKKINNLPIPKNKSFKSLSRSKRGGSYKSKFNKKITKKRKKIY